MIYTLSLKVY